MYWLYLILAVTLVTGWSLNIGAPLTCVCGLCESLNDGVYLYLLLLLLLLVFYPFLLFLPTSPSRSLLLSLSSSSVLVNHRVDASQLNLTEPLNHGTCHNSFLSPCTRHLPEHKLTAAVWSLICFPLIRCKSGWSSSPQTRRTRQPCDPQIIQETRNYVLSVPLCLSLCPWKITSAVFCVYFLIIINNVFVINN